MILMFCDGKVILSFRRQLARLFILKDVKKILQMKAKAKEEIVYIILPWL